ncbi:MAG: YrdB family protein [Leptospirales bacterium]
MGSHPINLAVRFLLELSALVAMGAWGWRQTDGWFRFVLALGVPLIFAVMWGTFAVPDDPSRSGKAPVPVPGMVRLTLELAFFTIGTWMLYQSGYPTPGFIFGVVVVVHYLVSYDRVSWLIQQ